MKRILCLMLLCFLLLTGCVRTPSAQKTVFSMDTVMTLQVWGEDADKAVAQLSQLLTELEQKWSVTAADSVPGRLNAGQTVEDPLLAEILALSERTNGAFDPRLGSWSELWGFRSRTYQVPTPAQLEAAAKTVTWDFGAVIKGHAADRAVTHLQQLQVQRAMLDFGGSIQTYGSKPDGTPWQIGIRDPFDQGVLGAVSVSGTMAVVTSGDYQRFFEAEGIRYHHILDPNTGCPAQSGLSAVTVICENGTTADALSTALFVMGLEEGVRLWRESEDFEAVFVREDGRVFATEGVQLSGCEFEVIRR